VPRPTKAVYSLVISFGSPGDGTDRAAFDRLEAAVKTLPQVPRARGRWGKEGEHDECFDLTALTSAERKTFVDRARGAIAPSTKTDAHENAACNDDKRR
jgi:hypothetical protein